MTITDTYEDFSSSPFVALTIPPLDNADNESSPLLSHTDKQSDLSAQSGPRIINMYIDMSKFHQNGLTRWLDRAVNLVMLIFISLYLVGIIMNIGTVGQCTRIRRQQLLQFNSTTGNSSVDTVSAGMAAIYRKMSCESLTEEVCPCPGFDEQLQRCSDSCSSLPPVVSPLHPDAPWQLPTEFWDFAARSVLYPFQYNTAAQDSTDHSADHSVVYTWLLVLFCFGIIFIIMLSGMWAANCSVCRKLVHGDVVRLCPCPNDKYYVFSQLDYHRIHCEKMKK